MGNGETKLYLYEAALSFDPKNLTQINQERDDCHTKLYAPGKKGCHTYIHENFAFFTSLGDDMDNSYKLLHGAYIEGIHSQWFRVPLPWNQNDLVWEVQSTYANFIQPDFIFAKKTGFTHNLNYGDNKSNNTPNEDNENNNTNNGDDKKSCMNSCNENELRLEDGNAISTDSNNSIPKKENHADVNKTDISNNHRNSESNRNCFYDGNDDSIVKLANIKCASNEWNKTNDKISELLKTKGENDEQLEYVIWEIEISWLHESKYRYYLTCDSDHQIEPEEMIVEKEDERFIAECETLNCLLLRAEATAAQKATCVQTFFHSSIAIYVRSLVFVLKDNQTIIEKVHFGKAKRIFLADHLRS